ncbi:MAG: protein kinase [Proteobacteria bacterium]|nr:protein kinase [Pseudomonadota bacterium]
MLLVTSVRGRSINAGEMRTLVFRIIERLSEGRETVIYRAENGGGQVILKALRGEYPTARQRARLRCEYDLCRHLALADAAGIVQAAELTEFEDRPAIVFKDTGGAVLSHVLEAKRQTVAQATRIGVQLARAIGEVHRAGVVHKDIKPSNVLLDEADASVTIIDFGISSLLATERKRAVGPSRLEGTLAYCSPEQTGRMNRAVDHRSDFYSLGATLYEFLVGRRPLTSDDALELVHCHIARTPVPPHEADPSLPRNVSDVVMRLLAKSPEDRYQTARGIAADLKRCLETAEPFELGTDDVSDRLAVSERLYGREGAIAQLMDAFRRAAGGRSEALWVYGYSGIGKSALIREVHKPIVEERGYLPRRQVRPVQPQHPLRLAHPGVRGTGRPAPQREPRSGGPVEGQDRRRPRRQRLRHHRRASRGRTHHRRAAPRPRAERRRRRPPVPRAVRPLRRGPGRVRPPPGALPGRPPVGRPALPEPARRARHGPAGRLAAPHRELPRQRGAAVPPGRDHARRHPHQTSRCGHGRGLRHRIAGPRTGRPRRHDRGHGPTPGGRGALPGRADPVQDRGQPLLRESVP